MNRDLGRNGKSDNYKAYEDRVTNIENIVKYVDKHHIIDARYGGGGVPLEEEAGNNRRNHLAAATQDNAHVNQSQQKTDLSSGEEDNDKNKKQVILKKISKVLEKRQQFQSQISQIRERTRRNNILEQEKHGLRYLTYARAKQIVSTQQIPAEQRQPNSELRAKYDSVIMEDLSTGQISRRNWSGKNVYRSTEELQKRMKVEENKEQQQRASARK